MRNTIILAIVTSLSLAACICDGPDRPVYVTESLRTVFTGGQEFDFPLTCTPEMYTHECPFLAYVERLSIEEIATDSLGRWALAWWKPEGVDGLTLQHISTGPLGQPPGTGPGSECLTVDEASDNTGLRDSYLMCRETVAGAEQWSARILWRLHSPAGFSKFRFETGLVY